MNAFIHDILKDVVLPYTPAAVVHPGIDDEIGGDGYITNLHVTDLHIEGPVPQQTCIFKFLKELDLDGGNLTGTIPEFLTTCFPEVNMHRQ